MVTVVFAPQVRLAGPRLDARLAAGEDPFSSPALALRAARLSSTRLRRQLAEGIEHALAGGGNGTLTAAVPADAAAVEIARPALVQLAAALQSRDRVGVRGVAMTQLLLTQPGSALYAPGSPEELYGRAREALLAL